jgi:hypothetical protein
MLHEEYEKTFIFFTGNKFSVRYSLGCVLLLVERKASDVKIGKYPAALKRERWRGKCSTHAFISFCLSYIYMI